MQREQLAAMRQTARRFARQEVAPLVSTEGRDGRLEQLPALLERAVEAGLLATTDPEDAGFDYGVWGRASQTEGAASSLAVLEELAVECAGVAAVVHFAGLGAQELGPEGPHGPAAVALFGRGWRPTWEGLRAPPRGTAQLGDTGLLGGCHFVWGPPATERYLVYAAGESGWARVWVAADAPGLTVAPVEPRTGLAAARVCHLHFDAVEVTAAMRLPSTSPAEHLRRLLLGLAALAVGNARGALREASRYAAERYQGGRIIAHHAAVQLLLGEAASRMEGARAHLHRACDAPDGVAGLDGADARLWHALAAKLRCCADGARAVTDCLQVLGGYGYMEEYRLEKRLRDAMTLEALVLAPDPLRRLLGAPLGGDHV